jgi:hypothetical protein
MPTKFQDPWEQPRPILYLENINQPKAGKNRIITITRISWKLVKAEHPSQSKLTITKTHTSLAVEKGKLYKDPTGFYWFSFYNYTHMTQPTNLQNKATNKTYEAQTHRHNTNMSAPIINNLRKWDNSM